MKISEFAVSRIEDVLDAVLKNGSRTRTVRDITIVHRKEGIADPEYVLLGETEAGNAVSCRVLLPKEGLLRTDTLFGAVSVLYPALEDALRGLEATGRLIDSIHPNAFEFNFADFEAIIRDTVDKEIRDQFDRSSSLYSSFYRKPFEGLKEAIDASGFKSDYRMPFYTEE